jgi:TatD DNase family protein
MIFDTHAHYDDPSFLEDREELLQALAPAGVGRVINVGCCVASSFSCVEMARQYDFMYATVGVHPDDTADLSDEDLITLKALARKNLYRDGSAGKVVAVGEIGYDFYRDDHVEESVQRRWFEAQLEMANELDLPVIIHSRKAAQMTYDTLKAHKTGDGAGIMHCYGYSVEMARQYLNLGYYIGLGGVVTFKNARVAKEVAAYVPEDRLLIETDCPYISPTPLRGTRNDSRNLHYVVKALAEIRGVTEEEIERTTWENACRLYRIEA